MKTYKIISIVMLSMHFFNFNIYSQTDNCPILLEVKNTIDSIHNEIGIQEKLIFSIQYLEIENEDNYFFALTVNNKLSHLILSDTSYYISCEKSFLIINNFLSDEINGKIEDFFCGVKLLDSSTVKSIEQSFINIERKKIPNNLDHLYYFRKQHGKLYRKNVNRWIRNNRW